MQFHLSACHLYVRCAVNFGSSLFVCFLVAVVSAGDGLAQSLVLYFPLRSMRHDRDGLVPEGFGYVGCCFFYVSYVYVSVATNFAGVVGCNLLYLIARRAGQRFSQDLYDREGETWYVLGGGAKAT